jgi:signal transduction histidine kinase
MDGGGLCLNKKYLVFPVLLVLLSAFLVMGYVNQTDQTQRKESIKELVIEAAIIIEDKGEDAFSDFRQEGTKWFRGDTYVFVWMTDGIRVVYPPDPTGEGQNMSMLLDVTGKAIGRLFIEIALSEEGEGWIDYSWPKPEETEPSSKQTYIKGVTVDEQTFLVGSGVYIDTSANVMKPLQYLSITMETVVAATGLFIAVRKKRVFGYGIFLTFLIYVFYDLVNLLQLEVSEFTLYPVFFVATLSIVWATLLIYMEK